MNSKLHELRLTVELRQVTDAVQTIFHSLLLHRTLGKFRYKHENSFELGSLGIKEVDCENIDLTYARINSPELALFIDEDVRLFQAEVSEASQSGSAPRMKPQLAGSPDNAVPLLSAQISIEFYNKQKQRRTIGSYFTGGVSEDFVWEQWKLILDIFQVESYDELQKMRQTVADTVGEIVLGMCEKINHAVYTPKMPSRSEIEDIFDTRFNDCQPYLFKIKRQASPLIAAKPSFAQAAFQRLWHDVIVS